MRVESHERTMRRVEPEPELDLGGIGRAAWAKRNWIIGPTILALLASAAFVNIVKPRYTAEARVLLELQNSFMPGDDPKGESVVTALDAEAVGSQIQLVTSRDVARKAIKEIGLLGNPEFDPMAGGLSAVSRMMVLFGLKRDPTQQSPEDRVLENYYDKLQVFSPTKTRVVNIEFQSHDPDLAAKAANTIAGIYLDFQQDAKRANARAAAQSLGSLVADLKARVAQAESKAEDFRTQTGLLVGTNNTTITAQQLGEVNTELARARTSMADAQAKAKLIREMLKQGRVSEVPDVANNDLIRRISEQRVTLKAQMALESRTLLPGHPRMKELAAQLADLDNELRVAAEKTARTLENDSRIAGQRVQNLQASLDQQKKIVGSLSAEEVKLRELDRVAKLAKDDLEAATTKYQQALARENSKSTPADARIVSRAIAPPLPSFPKKLPIIAFSTIAAFILSLAIVVARQLASDRTLRRMSAPARVEPDLDPVVSEDVAGGDAVAATVAPVVTPAPARPAPSASSALLPKAESFAREIVAAAQNHPALALCVSEGDDDQGFALSTARVLARNGRTILVAMDETARLPIAGGPGLAELLSGRASFHQTIHRDPVSRLHVLECGSGAGAGADALLSALDSLLEAYDYVLVAASGDLDIDEAFALSQLTRAVAVHALDPQSAVMLADALEGSGLPRATIVGAEDVRPAQTAA